MTHCSNPIFFSRNYSPLDHNDTAMTERSLSNGVKRGKWRIPAEKKYATDKVATIKLSYSQINRLLCALFDAERFNDEKYPALTQDVADLRRIIAAQQGAATSAAFEKDYPSPQFGYEYGPKS